MLVMWPLPSEQCFVPTSLRGSIYSLVTTAMFQIPKHQKIFYLHYDIEQEHFYICFAVIGLGKSYILHLFF